MSAAKKPNGRTVVGASFNSDELAELDKHRVDLGVGDSGEPKYSRAGALKLVWQKFGDDAVAQQARAAAAAKASQPQIDALVDALKIAAAAWSQRARQRQGISANKNQVARFTNTLRLVVRDGGQLTEDRVESVSLALQGIGHQLEAQTAAERADDQVIAAVRTLVDQMQSAP